MEWSSPKTRQRFYRRILLCENLAFLLVTHSERLAAAYSAIFAQSPQPNYGFFGQGRVDTVLVPRQEPGQLSWYPQTPPLRKPSRRRPLLQVFAKPDFALAAAPHSTTVEENWSSPKWVRSDASLTACHHQDDTN